MGFYCLVYYSMPSYVHASWWDYHASYIVSNLVEMLESLLVSLVFIEIVMSSLYVFLVHGQTFTYLFYWFLLETIHPLVMCLYKWFIHTRSISLFMHDSIIVVLRKIDGLHCLWTIWHVLCEERPSYLHVVLIYDGYNVALKIYSWFILFSRVLHAITLHFIISAKFCNLYLRCKLC